MLYLAFAIGLFCVFLNEKAEKVNKKFLYAFVFSLFLIVVLRFGIGADYISYNYLYKIIDTNNLNQSFIILADIEWLFKYLMMNAKFIGIPYHLFNVIISSLVLALTLNWIVKKSPNIYFSILLYLSMFFFVWTLSALRQGLVIAVLLNVFFGDKKYGLKTQILISVALFFIHSSAIIALFIYLISKMNFNKKTILYLFIFSLLFNIIPITENLSFLENVPYINKLLYYIDPVKLSVFSFTAGMRILFFLLVWSQYDQLIETYKDKTLINFLLINYVIFFLLLFSVITSSRISIFGHITLVVVLPMILELIPRSNKRKLVFSSLVVFSIFLFTKELNTVISQSGFEGTKMELNFITIFNGDLKQFDNPYSFDASVDESSELTNEDFDESKYIIAKDQKEIPYNPEKSHISVYFPNEKLYGIINEDGEIVELPNSNTRSKIYGNAVEVIYNPYDFKTVLYRKMNTGNTFTYHETLEIVKKGNDELTRFNAFWYEKVDVDLEKYQNGEFLKRYNLKPIQETKKISSEFHADYSYLNLSSSIANYYIFLDKNEDILVKHIYTRIDAFNENNIAIGYTKTEKHFINQKGEIIWVEDKVIQ